MLENKNVVRPDDALRELGNILKAIVLQSHNEMLRLPNSLIVEASHMDLAIVKNEVGLVLTVIDKRQQHKTKHK